MPSTKPNTPKKSKLRRLSDGLRSGSVLVPILEKNLLKQSDIWPEEYSIHVYNKERVKDGFFHPSSHAVAPDLFLFYEFHPEYELRNSLTVEQIMTFQVGSAYHALIQSMLIHLGMLEPAMCEVPFVNRRRNCSGTLDIRLMEMPTGDTMPVEFKSAGYGANIPEHFMRKYVAQLQVYMDAAFDEPQEKGLLLILEKTAPHRFREILLYRDEAILNDVYSRWNRVLEALEFDDPSMLQFPCHTFDSREHQDCPARFFCPLGMPTGERRPRIHSGN